MPPWVPGLMVVAMDASVSLMNALRQIVFAAWINVVLVAGIVLYALALAGGHLGFRDSPVSDQTRDLLWFALLCGLAAFATIEILKRVFGLRGAFQQWQTRAWLRARGGASLSNTGDDSSESPDRAFTELSGAMGVYEGRDLRRVFNLPTEQLAAQVSAAADRAMAERARYLVLLRALTGDPTQTEPAADEGSADGEGWAEGERSAEDARREEYLLSHAVRAGVDQLQIALGERWRRYVQGAALWISGAFGIALVSASATDDDAEKRYVLVAVLLGGMIAWLARDVVAVVERARR